MIKKIICSLLIFSMFCNFIPVFASGAAYENVNLLNADDVTEGIYLNEGVITLAALKSIEKTIQTTAYFNINDTVINGNPDRCMVQIEVDYYDGGKGGYFHLTYDSFENSPKQSQDIGSIFGTTADVPGVKKTKTFVLYDAKMGNGMTNGADFSITSNMYDVNIFAVRARVLETKAPISVTAESQSPGNIFFDGDERVLDIVFTNKSAQKQSFTASYKIYEQDTNNVVDCGSDSFTAEGGKAITKVFVPNVTRYGCYVLEVALSGDSNGIFKIPFSISVLNTEDTRSEKLGVATHMMYSTYPADELSIIDKVGFDGVRIGYNWTWFEKYYANSVVYGSAEDKPVYSQPDKYTEYLNQVRKHGLDVKMIFSDLHHNYLNASGERPSMLDMPDCASQRMAYARALSAMLELNGDIISTVEILNEPDLAGSNRQGLDPSYYVALVKDTYEMVKPLYPSVEIASYASGNLWESRCEKWFNGSFNLDADNDGSYDLAQYSDAYVAHPYVKTFIDSNKVIQNAYEDIDVLRDELTKYGCGGKPLYHTEYGFSASEVVKGGTKYIGVWNRVGEREQAAKVVRHTLEMMGRNLGDKFYIYNFANTGFSDNYNEHNFGLVKSPDSDYPYAAKPGLIAIANLNEMLGGYTSCDIVAHDNNKSVYKFTDGTGREVYTFSAENDENYTFTPDGDNVAFYDMYGNAMSFDENSGSYTLPITNEPMYAVVGGTRPRVGKTLLDGEMLISAQFPTANSGDDVTVTVYDEAGNLIETHNTNLDDRKSCYIKREYDETRTYIIEYTTTALSESFRYAVKGDKTIDVNATVENNQMIVNAKLPGANIGDSVSLEVADNSGEAVYYDQLYLDEAYECKAAFCVPNAIEYTIRIGTRTLDAAYVITAKGGRLLFTVTKGVSMPQGFAELTADGLAPVVTVEFLDETEDFNLILAGYSERGMTYANILSKDDMTVDSKNPNKMTYTLDTSVLNGATGARFFVVNSTKILQPLGKKLEFN